METRLKNNIQPKNPLDSACLTHDIQYHNFKDLKSRHKADKELFSAAKKRIFAADSSLGERASALTVAPLIGLKQKIGMGARRSTRKKRCRKLPLATRRGGFLQYVAPIAAAAGAAASLYKAHKDSKQNKKLADEKVRHNLEMEKIASQGKGLRLKPYKRGKGLKKKRRRRRK